MADNPDFKGLYLRLKKGCSGQKYVTEFVEQGLIQHNRSFVEA